MKKARNQAILLLLLFVCFGSHLSRGDWTAIFESVVKLLVNGCLACFRKRLKYGKESHNFCTEDFSLQVFY